MSILDSIRSTFSRTPATIDKAASLDAFGALGAVAAGGNGSGRKGREEILTAYTENPSLRLTTHAAASAVARVGWHVYRPADASSAQLATSYARMDPMTRAAFKTKAIAAGALIELPHHPAAKLLDRPNASMSGFAFRMLAEVHYRLLGEWAAVIVDGKSTKMPESMWLIPTTWIREFPTRDRPTYIVDLSMADGSRYVAHVPVTNLILARDLDPANPYGRGVGAGLSLADEIDVDENAAQMVGAYFKNGGMPSFIVSMEGAGQAALERAKAKWSSSFRGFSRAYQTFFTGAKLSAQRLDTTFKDMNLVEIRKAQRDLMVSSSGMPPEKVGILSSSNRATIEAADIIEAKNVIIPACEILRIEFQTKLLARYDDRLILDYDDPTPADVDRENTVMMTSSHVFKIDELRALAGRDPLPDGQGDAFLVDPTKVYVKTLSALARAKTIANFHMSGGAITNNELRETIGLEPTSEPWGDARTTAFYQPPSDYDDDDITAEDAKTLSVQAQVSAVLGAQKRASFKRRSVSRSIIRRILASIEAAELASTSSEVERLMSEWGDETLKAIDNNATFDSKTEAMKGYVDDYASQRVGMINATTRNDVKRALDDWDGEDVDGVLSSLGDVFTKARVERSQVIASCESVRASEFAAVEAYKQSGIVAKKEWIAVADGRTREAHLTLDGQIRDLDEPFEVTSGEHSGAQAMQPGGFGIGALDINCRCQSAPVFDEDVDTPRSAEQRASIWVERDAKLRRLESRVRDAFEDAFAKQQKAALAVAKNLLD